MPLIDHKQNIADRADADSRARERSQAMSQALRADLDARKERQRARQEALGIPTSTPISGVDPEVQAERDERKARASASMSDIIRGTRDARARRSGMTTNEILAEQTRGHRR